MRRERKKTGWILFLSGILITVLITFLSNKIVLKTSSDEYCASCHVHPQAIQSWKLSTHYDNKNGIRVRCVDCHLPPHGEGYLPEKARTGIRDLWSNTFKDPESFNWEEKSQIEYARTHSFESSCIHCHQNIYPIGLNKEGRSAHLYYEQKAGELHCINCHITVGHYDPNRRHASNTVFGNIVEENTDIYTLPARIEGFRNYTEFIPGSAVSFDMIAIPGGSFLMGSPEHEAFRSDNEGPQKEVEISPFFMAKMEVSWDEYLAFFKETGAHGKTSDAYLSDEVDGISGPTPPWGAPDQGWGTGALPAITMTHHAASVYCEWLSSITDKKYRLPTEAEWEYAARGATQSPYFFDGDPRRYVRQGLRNKLFGIDTSNINTYISYEENSNARPMLPPAVKENPFGLSHMLGNVAEFCSDRYAPDSYKQYKPGLLTDPAGPDSGEEYVVRGGSYRDAADGVRSASRKPTRSTAWLKTDPQMPKSIWWYSDCIHVGFRVVCEYDYNTD